MSWLDIFFLNLLKVTIDSPILSVLLNLFLGSLSSFGAIKEMEVSFIPSLMIEVKTVPRFWAEASDPWMEI